VGWRGDVHQVTDQLTKLLRQHMEMGTGQEGEEEKEEDDGQGKNNKVSRLLVAVIAQTCELLESDDKHLDTVSPL
jgi:hypothetical protein